VGYRGPMRLVALALAAALAASACGAPRTDPASALDDDAVTVASFNFTESRILAELYAQALEARGIPVERQLNLGPRELVEPALERGLVELVPEYAGSLLGFLGGTASAHPADTLGHLRPALRERGLIALELAPAENRNAFVVTRIVADRLEAGSLSDLARIGGLVLGGPPECTRRPLCLPGLESVYGIRFAGFVPLDPAGPITADALRRGVVDVALMFSTSPELLQPGFVELEDDRGLQPAENVVPVVHETTLSRFGAELPAALEAVSSALSTGELRALNAAVASGVAEPGEVAREWLSAHGLVPDAG